MLKVNLRKKITLIVAFMIASSSATSFAQVKDGLNFEAGGGYHFNGVFDASNGSWKTSGPEAYFEIRNCEKHFDYGGQLCYKYSTGSGYATEDGPLLDQTCHMALLKAISDYNICPNGIANPYVGLGLGLGYLHVDRSDNLKSDNLAFALSLRLGVQISLVRLTFDYDMYRKSFGTKSARLRASGKPLAYTLSLTLGIAF